MPELYDQYWYNFCIEELERRGFERPAEEMLIGAPLPKGVHIFPFDKAKHSPVATRVAGRKYTREYSSESKTHLFVATSYHPHRTKQQTVGLTIPLIFSRHCPEKSEIAAYQVIDDKGYLTSDRYILSPPSNTEKRTALLVKAPPSERELSFLLVPQSAEKTIAEVIERFLG